MSLQAFVDAAARRVRDGFYETAGEPMRNHGSLASALRGEARILAELKPRAPSAGRLLEGDPARVLASYRRGGAAGISVLTDADHFDGSPALLRQAHGEGLPTLLKDFVVGEPQVACAAHHGASAVLLIERILAPRRRDELIEAAHGHGLEVLLEVHASDDVEGALATEADMVGVNARDLDTLEVDAEAAYAVVRQVADAGRHAAALSGIADRADRLRAEEAGAQGCLVGTHLMRQHDPGLALAALRRPLAKVCGVTDEGALEAAADADLVGFVVHAHSPRELSEDACRRLVMAAHAQGSRPVLVTKEAVARTAALAQEVGAAFVQASRFGGEAQGILHRASIGRLHVVHPGDPAPAGDGIVVDTPSPRGGGSGQKHDWAEAAASVRTARGRPSLVAGGLDAASAPEAVRVSAAWGADASSGLEAEPGRKDPARIRAYVAAVHGGGEDPGGRTGRRAKEAEA